MSCQLIIRRRKVRSSSTNYILGPVGLEEQDPRLPIDIFGTRVSFDDFCYRNEPEVYNLTHGWQIPVPVTLSRPFALVTLQVGFAEIPIWELMFCSGAHLERLSKVLGHRRTGIHTLVAGLSRSGERVRPIMRMSGFAAILGTCALATFELGLEPPRNRFLENQISRMSRQHKDDTYPEIVERVIFQDVKARLHNLRGDHVHEQAERIRQSIAGLRHACKNHRALISHISSRDRECEIEKRLNRAQSTTRGMLYYDRNTCREKAIELVNRLEALSLPELDRDHT